MASKLLGPARRAVDKDRLKNYPRVSRDASRLAAAVEVLLEATDWGEKISLDEVWKSIEARVTRSELRAAVAYVTDTVPPPEADPDGGVRAALVEKITTVRGFLPMLCEHIEFGATSQAEPLLKAMREFGELVKTSGLSAKKPVPKKLVICSESEPRRGSWARDAMTTIMRCGRPGRFGWSPHVAAGSCCRRSRRRSACDTGWAA